MKKNKQYTICIAGHHFYTQKQGGVEMQTRYIGEALANAGWKVVFLSPSHNGEKGHEKINEKIYVWWYPFYSYEVIPPTALIEKILDTIQPDVFYQRGRVHFVGSKIILRYSHKRSVPYVFALSSDRELDCLYETKTTLRLYKPLWKKIIRIPTALWLDKSIQKILRCADYIIAQHEGQFNGVIEKIRRTPCLIRTIHPELNREIRKSDQNIALWVTNYRPFKKGELFVQLAERCKELNCRFIMVYGRTKKEYIEPVLHEAKGKDNLTIYGEMPPHEVENLMEKAILFVNTSLLWEGFPNTFVQSWLRETPTISLYVNPGEVLTKEKVGLCSGSFEKLVRDVAFLVENDKERIAMGKRAHIYAEQAHGFEHNAGKIAEFFSNVVEKRSPIGR